MNNETYSEAEIELAQKLVEVGDSWDIMSNKDQIAWRHNARISLAHCAAKNAMPPEKRQKLIQDLATFSGITVNSAERFLVTRKLIPEPSEPSIGELIWDNTEHPASRPHTAALIDSLIIPLVEHARKTGGDAALAPIDALKSKASKP